MNRKKPTNVFVGHKLVEKAEKTAKKTDRHFKGRTNLAYSKGNRGTDKRRHLYTFSKVSECGVCIFLGMNPLNDLNWKTGEPDGGVDITAPNGMTIDVKSSDHPNASRLMYPVKNKHRLDDAADIFVFTRVLERSKSDLGQNVELVGWTTRDYFQRMCWVANGIKGVVDGTQYLNEKDLYNMEDLVHHLSDVKETS